MKIRSEIPKTRRQPRLRVFDARATSDELSFVILDMSTMGLRIESRDPVVVGREYRFTIEHAGAPILVHAEARWCKVDRTIEIGRGEFQTIYRAGFAFESADPSRTRVENETAAGHAGFGLEQLRELDRLRVDSGR